MATKWKPLGGTEWLLLPDALLDEPLPERPATTPRKRRGMPELVPYAYRGSDFSLPEEITVTGTRPVRPAVREATALDDPALLFAGVPVSRPRGWGEDQ